MLRENPYRFNTPPGWQDMSNAPRDGTVIEIQNNWGVAPWFAICFWSVKSSSWRRVDDSNSGPASEGIHLSWRPYYGEIGEYTDPTFGAQETEEYWLRACGMSSSAVDHLNARAEEGVRGALPRAFDDYLTAESKRKKIASRERYDGVASDGSMALTAVMLLVCIAVVMIVITIAPT